VQEVWQASRLVYIKFELFDLASAMGVLGCVRARLEELEM
jgi:hypothetical protein